MWMSTMDEPWVAMRSPAYLIMLYSLIFRLIKSWLVTAAFCNDREIQLGKSDIFNLKLCFFNLSAAYFRFLILIMYIYNISVTTTANLKTFTMWQEVVTCLTD